MDTYSFIVFVKTNDIYKGIADIVETKLNTSNYELECSSIDKPFSKRKNKKEIGLKKDELRGKIIAKFLGLRVEAYSYIIDDSSEDKKTKGAKK